MALHPKNFGDQELLYAAANAIDAAQITKATALVQVNDAIEKIEEILERP
jgi:hypothetical protein